METKRLAWVVLAVGTMSLVLGPMFILAGILYGHIHLVAVGVFGLLSGLLSYTVVLNAWHKGLLSPNKVRR